MYAEMTKPSQSKGQEVFLSPAAENLSGNGACWSLISSVAAKDLLSSVAIQSLEASVLLLECTDIASILKTVDRNLPQPSRTPPSNNGAEIGSRAKENPCGIPDSFEFHIHNANPVALARIALLLILATNHGIDEAADVDLFWAVWSNCLLTRPQFRRFQSASQKLARHDFSPYHSSAFQFPHSSLKALTSIWKAWAACVNFPSARSVEETRLGYESFSITDEADSISLREGKSITFLAHRFAQTFMHAAFSTPFSVDETYIAVVREVCHHYLSGMSQREHFGRGPGTAQLNAEYVPNPSLLDPKTWECRVPISSTPFTFLAPMNFDALGTQSLHMYSIGILEKQLRSFRFCSELNKLSFSFHGGDPLLLALHHLPRYLTTGHQDQAATEWVQQQGRFDVIHAASLVDRVGVLNVLLCCGRLLYPSPTSRLFTCTTEWHKDAPSLKVFITKSMPFLPLHLLPSLTGMCVATDFVFDSQSPAVTNSPLPWRDSTDLNRERVVAWRPAVGGTEAAERPSHIPGQGGKGGSRGPEMCRRQTPLTLVVSSHESVRGRMRSRRHLLPCGIWRVVVDAFRQSCGGEDVNDVMSGHRNHHSPLTWCLLVCHLSAQLAPESLSRLRWQDLNGGQGDEGHRRRYWLGLRAMIQYLLTVLPFLHTPNLWLLFGCMGEQEGVVRYQKRVKVGQHSSVSVFSAHKQFRVLLEVSPQGPPDKPCVPRAGTHESLSAPHQTHIIDNIRISTAGDEADITFYLPGRHGLKPSDVYVHLSNGDTQVESFGLLSEMEETPVQRPASRCTENEVKGRGRGSRLLALCEFEECYEATVEVAPHAESVVDVMWPPGQAATWHVELTVGSTVIPLSFACPVRIKEDHVASPSESGTVLRTFHKVASWPLTRVERSVRIVAIDGLAEWPARPLCIATNCQFSGQEKAVLAGHATHLHLKYDDGFRSFILRLAVHIILMGHYYKPAKEYQWGPYVSRDIEEEENMMVFIQGKKGLRRDEEGRPLMEVVFKTWSQEQLLLAPKAMLRNKINLTFTLLLHQLLSRNSALVEPSEWQKKIVRSEPEFTPSFLTTLGSGGAHTIEGLPIEQTLSVLAKMEMATDYSQSPLIADLMHMVRNKGLPMHFLNC